MVTTFVNHRNYGCRGAIYMPCFICLITCLIIQKAIKSTLIHHFSMIMMMSKPDFNHTFYFEPPSSLMVRVSNFKNLVILHFAKGNRYLPMREDKFNDLIAMHDSIMAQIKKCKKVIHLIYKKSDSEKEE